MRAGFKLCQYTAMTRNLNTDKIGNLWEVVNHCFRNILSKPVFTLAQLVKEMGAQANAYYCYLEMWLKNYLDLNISTTCPNPLYRAVWLSVEPGNRSEVLVRGPLWQNSINASIKRGRTFTPNIDFVDTGSQSCIFLTTEQQCCCPAVHPDLSLAVGCEERITQRYSITDTITLIQMPWKVVCHDDSSFYVYCLIAEDIWFYATTPDIKLAYQEYLHQ